jgi:hypothetical protein
MDWGLALIYLKLVCGAFLFPALFFKGACDFFWLLHVPSSYTDRTFSLCVRVVWMVAAALGLCLIAFNRAPQTGFVCFG